MAQPVSVSMPPDVDINEGYVLQIAALQATDGSAVSGVKISNMAIEIDHISVGSLDSGAFAPVLIRQAT